MRSNQKYFNNVKGKLGELDIIGVDDDDYVVNKAGARIYKDLSKHTELEIPTLTNEKETGLVYEVLSVGIMSPGLPIVTVKNGESPIAFKLPKELASWVQTSMDMSLLGIRLFPAQVEFGKLKQRYFAQIL